MEVGEDGIEMFWFFNKDFSKRERGKTDSLNSLAPWKLEIAGWKRTGFWEPNQSLEVNDGKKIIW